MKTETIMARLSASQLEKLLHQKKAQENVAPLERKKAKLLKAVAKLQKKIDRLLGSKAAPAAKPGRPTKKAGRPRKRRKLTAAARRKIVQAQKARWAKFHAAKKAKTSE